jgi:aminoglycoside phosphotransferase (APT) family kinase protein
MHQNNIFHNDYSPGNILIKKSITGKYIFKVVDINRMKFFSLNENDRAKNFAKLWASDDILRIIAEEYLKHYQITSEQEFIENVLRYSQDNKNFKNFKKHLKGQEVTD